MPFLLVFAAGAVVGVTGGYIVSDTGKKLAIGGALAAGAYLYFKRGK